MSAWVRSLGEMSMLAKKPKFVVMNYLNPAADGSPAVEQCSSDSSERKDMSTNHRRDIQVLTVHSTERNSNRQEK